MDNGYKKAYKITGGDELVVFGKHAVVVDARIVVTNSGKRVAIKYYVDGEDGFKYIEPKWDWVYAEWPTQAIKSENTSGNGS